MIKIDTNKTLYGSLLDVVEQYPDKESLVLGDTRLTYRQLVDKIDSLAAGLSKTGIVKGDNVGIILPNVLEGFVAFFALTSIGAIAVPINIRLGSHDLGYILNEIDVVAVITTAEVMGRPYLPMIQNLQKNLPKLRQVIVQGRTNGNGIVSLDNLMQLSDKENAPQVDMSPDDVCCIFCTSGTTGLPKGAMHTHKSALAICDSLLQARGREDLDVMLAPYPLFHIGGIVILLPLLIGGKLIVMQTFNPRGVLQAIEKEQISCFAAVPLFFRAVLQVKDFDDFDLSSLRLVGGGGAAFSPDLVNDIYSRFGENKFFQGYGLTEAMWVSAASFDDPYEKQLNSVGLPSKVQAEIKIVDDDKRILPRGEVGEVACRTPGMMKGYFNRPEETSNIIDDEGWLYTGDLGLVDGEGYLTLVDRKKDMIKRGAEGIFPAEIEHFIISHPKIKIASVIGVPSEVGGEKRIFAYVQLWEGTELSENEVIEFCQGQIAAYKIPEKVHIVESLPMTATQKVQKFKLLEEAQKKQDE
jgi:fatty-acyl-CoA synthase